MGRLQQLRNMSADEVRRIHRAHAQVGGDDEKAVELLADLRAYCGQAWPKMLERALRRYRETQRRRD